MEEIKETLLGLKDEIIEKLISKDVMTPDLINVLKDAASKAGDEIKAWFQELIKTPANAVKSLLTDRDAIASFAAKMFKYVLDKSKTAKKAVVNLFAKSEMFSGKAAMLTLGIIKLATGKLDDTENIVGAASDIWKGSLRVSGKDNTLDARHYMRDIMGFLPKAIEGLLGGENPVEVLFRAVGGDPTKLVKHALKLGVQALKKLGEKGVEAAMKKVGVQEDTKVWNAVKSASLAMLGAVTKGIGESRIRQNGLPASRAMVMS